MGKKSTRVTRRFSEESSRNRKKRPKTFASEELAREWAKKNKISKFKLENLKSTEASTKKIRINY